MLGTALISARAYRLAAGLHYRFVEGAG
jgi:hypothetical protein